MVKNFTMVDTCTNLAATHSLATRWMSTLDPVDNVEIVDVLFIDVVAA